MQQLTPNAPPHSSRHAIRVVTLVVVTLVTTCFVGAGVLAVRNFLAFGVRSKQADVKANLRAAYVAERSQLLEHGAYSEIVEEISFDPHHSRYFYLLSEKGDSLVPQTRDGGTHSSVAPSPVFSPMPTRAAALGAVPPELLSELGVRGECPSSCRVTIVAVGNIDVDEKLDVWSVSTAPRTIAGKSVPAGTPHNHVDDVAE
jgi:hypothetical protein